MLQVVLSPLMTRRTALTLALLLVGVVVWPSSPTTRAASPSPVRALHGMVGSTSVHASEAGLAMLKRGGTAVDAAVAVGFALAVTHPAAGNIGGGGFMLIRLPDGKAVALDYREVAPAAASRDMFLGENGEPVEARSRVGALASGVPGAVAGLYRAHAAYGRLPWADVVAPAVGLARDGFEISHALADSLASAQPLLSRFPASLQTFYKADGSAYAAGARLVQPDLARSLALIARDGPDAFYKGPIAALIVEEMRRSGGLITHADLASYTPQIREPVTGTYRSVRVISFPPASSGGIALLQALNVLEGFPLEAYGHNSSRAMHAIAETTRRVYADRAEWLGDPAFFDVPMRGLLSRRYAETLRASIDPLRATPSSQVRSGRPLDFESDQTTHYSVVDAQGMAVSTTTTINGLYGNGQVVPGAGFLLNNEMDDFSAKPGVPNMFGAIGGVANEIAPGKRMLSSMTPTILTRDGKLYLVLGSPGGTRIITTVLQVILNVVDFGMDVQQAVDAPRFHHQWLPDHLRLEEQGFPADVRQALEQLGHTLRVQADMGDVHAIMVDPATGRRLGASDPRLDGRTVGY